jgi:hypothetical protein
VTRVDLIFGGVFVFLVWDVNFGVSVCFGLKALERGAASIALAAFLLLRQAISGPYWD